MTAFCRAVGVLAVSFAAFAAQAQPIVKVPDASPHARVEQTVGLSDFSVTYARPAVKGRKVWGGLVPLGEVWRAGANENTVIAASTDFVVQGKKLPAGKYGFHVIPAASGPWTAVFSNVSTNWGSFSYDAKDDALRVQVTPEAAPAQERLSYEFDDVTDTTATLALRWEKVRLPLKLAVDTNEVTYASLKSQLHGLPQFFPRGWSDAAAWLLDHDTHLDDASAWADKSVQLQPNFHNQVLKARLLEKKGDAAGAQALREKALTRATEQELNTYGYTLLAAGKAREAIAIFERNVKDHPDSWNAYDSLGEALEQSGDKAGAKANYARALQLVKDEKQKARLQRTLAGL